MMAITCGQCSESEFQVSQVHHVPGVVTNYDIHYYKWATWPILLQQWKNLNEDYNERFKIIARSNGA